ncbi:hypothetical protein QNA08_06335 [Chelatococcus sp. SYSU_G07232]|uniref:DUF4232 domain-containing protein n=1 Tax=Chelatococcus albus TaxID=3047466 RepID=A0ABT7AEP9_9HYPH|nr:hypothetical protein [Chelatococcus sp. SYSU_G07232]MDJ1157848.1 hypothetical protein [Chelatococcus sp. SYSU_G07232]
MAFSSRTGLVRAARLAPALGLALLLAACASEGGSKKGDPEEGAAAPMLRRIFSGGGDSVLPVNPQQDEFDQDCPIVDVFEGGSAIRVGEGASLRHQISIANTARECASVPGGGYTVKVGVEGRALLGPTGSPGTFTAPVRIALKSGDRVIASRSRTVSVTIPAGQTQGSFVVVEEGLMVPPGQSDVTVEVGLGRGPAGEAPRRQRR